MEMNTNVGRYVFIRPWKKVILDGKFRLVYAVICVSCLSTLKLQYVHLMSDVLI